MISQKQLEEWQQQSLKDAQGYRKDEKEMNELHGDSKSRIRNFFERVRSRYFNFQSDENVKLSRLLAYTEMDKEIEHYPQILRNYITYNTCSIIIFAVCALAPKKLFSKIIISLVTYGLKTNITDGLFTYYTIESMALSERMTPQEQQLRNVVEFHYLHRFFKGSIASDEEKRQASQLIGKIHKLNETYEKFKQVEKLV